MTKLQETLEAIPKSNVEELMNLGDHVRPLLANVSVIAAHYPFLDQHLAFALMFGMLCASVEGLPTTMETIHGEMISFEDRLAMFVAIARVSYLGAYGLRKDVDIALGRRSPSTN